MHLVKNAIGVAKATSADPRYERIVTTHAHGQLRKNLASELGITIYVPGEQIKLYNSFVELVTKRWYQF